MAFQRCASELPDPEPQEVLDDALGWDRCGRDPIYLFACHLNGEIIEICLPTTNWWLHWTTPTRISGASPRRFCTDPPQTLNRTILANAQPCEEHMLIKSVESVALGRHLSARLAGSCARQWSAARVRS